MCDPEEHVLTAEPSNPGDLWHGKPQLWLKCINSEGEGDITRSGLVWSYPFAGYGTATPAVADGLAIVVSSNGTVHCVDTTTGKAVWTCDTEPEIWASPLIADGKVYLTSRNGYLVVLAAGRQKRIISSVRLGGSISASPTAVGDTLYVANMRTLFACGIKQPQRRPTALGAGQTTARRMPKP